MGLPKNGAERFAIARQPSGFGPACRNGRLEPDKVDPAVPGQAACMVNSKNTFAGAAREQRLRNRARPTNGSDRGVARSNLIRWAYFLSVMADIPLI